MYRKEIIQFPVQRSWYKDRWLLEIDVALKIQTLSGHSETFAFLFDTGSKFTTLSISMAHRIGLDVPTSRPVIIHGATGEGRGFLAPFNYSILGMDSFTFTTLACYSENMLGRPLLSLTDVLNHFSLRIRDPSRLHPLGTLELRLRKDHGGQLRQIP